MGLFKNIKRLYRQFRSQRRVKKTIKNVNEYAMNTHDSTSFDGLSIHCNTRDNEEIKFSIAFNILNFKHEDDYSHSEIWLNNNGINFLIHVEKFENFDAKRVTITLLNSIKNAGPFYYRNLRYGIDNKVVFSQNYPGVVLPGGIMPQRFYVGLDAYKLREYEHLSFPLQEEWINEKCRKGIDTFPKEQVGPWELGHSATKKDSSLNGSHGGGAIGPFQGGPYCWTRNNPQAWKYKEIEMLSVACRSPIAKTNEYGDFIIDPAPGWPGRTWNHEKPGWQYVPKLIDDDFNYIQHTDGELYLTDNQSNILKKPVGITNSGKTIWEKVKIPNHWWWCPYEKELFKYRAIDHTHLHRETRAAAMIAKYDAFARWFLRACWNDIANWLGSEGGSNNKALYNLAELLKSTPKHEGASWGGRGWAHVIRCYEYAQPWLTSSENYIPTSISSINSLGEFITWYDALKITTTHISTPNGICHKKDGDNKPKMENIPSARGREVDLMGPNFLFLKLDHLFAAYKNHCAPVGTDSLAESFEVTNLPSWRHGTYSNPNYFVGYDGIRGLYTEFGTPEETEVHAKMRSIYENPWDYHIRPVLK